VGNSKSQVPNYKTNRIWNLIFLKGYVKEHLWLKVKQIVRFCQGFNPLPLLHSLFSVLIIFRRRSGDQRFRGSRVLGSKVQGLHFRSWTAFEMLIYEKSVSFVRPNPKLGVKLAIIWGMSIFNAGCGPFLYP
jgi:hypothetical protein